jgi:acetyl-CoA C-acetyltransferase
VAHQVFEAWLTFALFEIARRAHLGMAPEEHRCLMGSLMAPMTQRAATNPQAWFPVARTAEELVTPTKENRMVALPYTKYLVSVMDVDMAAAVLVASTEKADAMGVPTDRRVHLLGSGYASDPPHVAAHQELWRSPAMAAASGRALAEAGVGVDDVAHMDLYSCFSSSVAFALDGLGLKDDETRSLTVTGGLPYFGGPGSNYMSHALAEMAHALRHDEASLGMVSGVGMHMQKHVYALYSTTPPARAPMPLRVDKAAATAGLPPPVPISDAYDGQATVAAYTVVHDRDGGPSWGVAVCDLPDGTRAYARMEGPDLLAHAEATELVGTAVEIRRGEGGVNVIGD